MKESIKVLALYADAGFGHRSAINAIVEALQERYGGACRIDVVNPLEDPRTPMLLRDSQADYDRMVRSAPELYKIGYQASDGAVTTTLVESALTVMLYEVMRDMVREYQPDVIVSTYPLYQAALDAVFTISRRYIPVIAVVTDLATVHRVWFFSRVKMCLVPNEKVARLALESGLKDEQVKVTGIPVRTSFAREKRTKAEIRAALGWQPDLTTVLAVGSKRSERFIPALHVINHLGYPLQIAAVAGGDSEDYASLQAEMWHHPAQIYNFVDNMPELMQASDLIACKAGGLIVTESLACGLPLLLIEAIPGQETGNASVVSEEGAGALALSDMEILETCSHWLMNGGEELDRLAQNASRAGKPQAAYQAAGLVWEAGQEGVLDKRGRHILGRPKILDLLRENKIRWEDRRAEVDSTD
jgi:1,2-diacylglycerol 3-beta-galactosyltransferase